MEARTLRRRLAWSWLLLLALLAAFGCSKDPEAPNYDNPFDPRTPADPFDLSAQVEGSTVVLTWTHRSGFDIVSYSVRRSTDGINYSAIASVNAPDTETATYTDTAPAATGTSYYRVVATDADGNVTLEGQAAPVAIQVPVLVVVANGAANTRTRHVPVRVMARGYEVARISRTADFADAQTVPFVGDSAVVDTWDLGPATSNDTALHVYACALRTQEIGGTLVTVSTDTAASPILVAFNPTLDLPAGVTTVPDRLVDFVIGGGVTGVTRLRLAPTAAELPAAPWRPAAATIEDYQLLDTPQAQLVYAEFESDFSPELTVVASRQVTPNNLASVSFHLVVPENRVISSPYVLVQNSAIATEMRISTDPGFRNVLWGAYADTVTVLLPAQPGFHVVYAQYRNYWTQSAVQTDWAIFAQGDLAVDFQNPLDGDVLEGGTLVQLRGRAWSRDTEAPIDSVKVNVGAGYVRARGTVEWNYNWQVPTVQGDQARIIGARAYSHHAVEGLPTAVIDSATALISVSLSQLSIAIGQPAGGAQLVGGSDVTVSGVAYAFAGGAPLDSVAVILPGARRHLTVSQGIWGTTWRAPEVTQIEPIQIIARAFAGADSVQALVNASLVPAP